MDSKITLSFDREVISKAKEYAASHNISLSRLTEFLYRQITDGQYKDLERLPVSDWVNQLAEGKIEYNTQSRTRKQLSEEYIKSKK